MKWAFMHDMLFFHSSLAQFSCFISQTSELWRHAKRSEIKHMRGGIKLGHDVNLTAWKWGETELRRERDTSAWISRFEFDNCTQNEKNLIFGQILKLQWQVKRCRIRRMMSGMKIRLWGESNDVKIRRNRVTKRKIQAFEHVVLNMKFYPNLCYFNMTKMDKEARLKYG